MSQKQRGITLVGFILVMIVVGFFATIAIQLVPVYNEYFSVVNAMKSVANEPGAASKDLRELQAALEKSFGLSYVESVQDDNITLITDNNQRQLNINYEARRKFLYNIDFVVKFDHTVELNNSVDGE